MAKITWTFKNEEGTNLNRYIATNVSTGEKITFDLLRGGNISVVGTPLNAENLNALITSINACYDLISSSEKDTTYTLSKNGNAIRLTSSDGTTNDVTLNKSDVGLGNVDNTSDMDKPISTAQQQGLNKPLYNLGAFDTISGNVITRQTGYGKFEDLNWVLTNVGEHYFWICLDLQNTIFKPSDNYTPSNNFIVTNQNINYVGGYQVSTTGDLGIDTSGAISYDNGSSTEKPSGILQYKLATSYTEEIIEGQPLITLDSQGSQWLREEWEKGLNLSPIASGNTNFLIDKELQAGTYTISFNYSFEGSGNYFGVNIVDNSTDTAIKTFSTETNKGRGYSRFNLTTATKIYINCWQIGTITNIMLNKGDHAYPYTPYNSKAHITNYEADFLKEEFEKGLNLLDFTTANPNYDRSGVISGDANVNNNGTIIVGVDASGSYGRGFKIQVKANTTYKFSFDKNITNNLYVEVFQNNTSIELNSFTTSGRLSLTFTTNSSSDFIVLGFSTTDSAIGTLTISNLMLNEGTEPLPYQEYNGSIIREKQLKELDNKKANKSETYTKEETNSLIDKIVAGETSLTNYYTKSEANELLNNKANKTDVYTKTETNNELANKVPTTRKINNKSLNQDISLSASDVGARPSSWTPSKTDIGLENVDNTKDIDKNVASAKILKNNDIKSFTLSAGIIEGINFNQNSMYLIYNNTWCFIIRIGEKNQYFTIQSTVCYNESTSRPLWFLYQNLDAFKLYLKTTKTVNNNEFATVYETDETFYYKLLSTD